MARISGGAWSLIYDGDDGVAWKLDTRKDGVPIAGGSLRYEYRDQRLAVGDAAGVVPNDVLRDIRDPLERSAGLFRLERYTLHRQVVDVLARELSLGEWVPAKVLRARLRSMPRELLIGSRSLIPALRPRYLTSRTSDDGSDFYTLTLAGLLESERSEATRRIIDGALAALGRLFEEDPRVEQYGWREVSETDGADLPFMWAAIEAAGLMNGGERLGQGMVFRVPKDIEDIVVCRDSTAFLAYLRSGASGRASPSAPLRFEVPSAIALDLAGDAKVPVEGVGGGSIGPLGPAGPIGVPPLSAPDSSLVGTMGTDGPVGPAGRIGSTSRSIWGKVVVGIGVVAGIATIVDVAGWTPWKSHSIGDDKTPAAHLPQGVRRRVIEGEIASVLRNRVSGGIEPGLGVLKSSVLYRSWFQLFPSGRILLIATSESGDTSRFSGTAFVFSANPGAPRWVALGTTHDGLDAIRDGRLLADEWRRANTDMASIAKKTGLAPLPYLSKQASAREPENLEQRFSGVPGQDASARLDGGIARLAAHFGLTNFIGWPFQWPCRAEIVVQEYENALVFGGAPHENCGDGDSLYLSIRERGLTHERGHDQGRWTPLSLPPLPASTSP